MKKTIKIFAIMLFCFIVSKGSIIAETYNNYSGSGKLFCGGSTAKEAIISSIPQGIPRIIHIIYIVIQVAVPVLLIIFGMIDLIKAIVAGKEDEIKKCQMTFLRRMIMAVLVFFVFVIVKLVVGIAADNNNKQGIIDCMDCFVNNSTTKGSNQCGGLK